MGKFHQGTHSKDAFSNNLHEFQYLTSCTAPRVFNAGGPTVWWTDPYGKNGQTNSFPGAVKQYLVGITIDIDATFSPGFIEPEALGKNDDYNDGTVHAPN